jgi:hypothetical protein
VRKLSFGPLLILLLIFLWNHFASAAAVNPSADLAQSLPEKQIAMKPGSKQLALKKLVTILPAKKKTLVILAGKNQVAEVLPTKKLVSSKKRSVVLVTKSTILPKQLPARTKVIMNFDQPALGEAPSVVIRDSGSNASAKDTEIQIVQKHDVFEAAAIETPEYEVEEPLAVSTTVKHKLMPALPDSDSFVALPPGLKRAPQEPQAVMSAKVTPKVAPTKSTLVSPVSTPFATLPLQTANQTSAQDETPAALSTAIATAMGEPSPSIPEEAALTPSTTSGDTTPAEFVGPLPPPVFDTTSEREDVRTTLSESEQAINAEKGARSEGYETHAAPAVQTTFLIPHDETPRRRIFVRGGYLNAKYEKLESDLKNGASVLGVSVSQVFSKTEIRLGIDVAHGLDQEVTLRNTRMIMFRGEGLYSVFTRDFAQVYIGGALGLANIDVTSYRSLNGSADVTVRENAKGTALLAAPEIGSRIHFSRDISLDLTLQYLLLAGGDQVANLGGLLGEAAVGFTF